MEPTESAQIVTTDRGPAVIVERKSWIAQKIDQLQAMIAGKADASTIQNTMVDKATFNSTVATMNASLSSKADVSTLATKADVSALATKANASSLSGKSNVGDSYLKSEDDSLLNLKLDKTAAYIKTEVDAFLQAKLDARRVVFSTVSVTIPAFTILGLKTVTATVNGLVVGDYVDAIPPSNRLVISQAQVTAANTVTITILAVGVLASTTDDWLIVAWKKS